MIQATLSQSSLFAANARLSDYRLATQPTHTFFSSEANYNSDIPVNLASEVRS